MFGDQAIPITVVLASGPRSSKAVKSPMLGSTIQGQVYVFVDSNTGAQVPLLCYSTNLKDLAKNDWYVDQTVAVVQKLTDEVNLGSTKDELLRWLPFLTNLHVNITTAKNGQKSVLFGWGKGKDGRVAQSYSIKLQPDGTISEKDARAFFTSIAGRKITLPSGEQRYPTTNVDRNRLNDKEYMDNISRYIKVNVTPNSPRTIDDWFEYEATPFQKKGKKPSTTNPVVPSTGKKGTTETVVTPSGEASVSSVGTVESETPLTPEQEQAVIDNATPKGTEAPIKADTTSIDNVSIDGAFGGASVARDDMPDTPRRKRRKPKALLVSETSDPSATQE